METNKDKRMKDIKPHIILTIFLYLVLAFAQMELNPLYWGENERIAFSGIVIFSNIIIYGYQINKDK